MAKLYRPVFPTLRPRSLYRIQRLTVVVWAVAVGGGTGWMTFASLNPSDTSGQSVVARAQRRWPAESGLMRKAGRWRLVMALHPKCPCSHASLAELDRLLCQLDGRLDATVLPMLPCLERSDWYQARNVKYAEGLKNAETVYDREGKESALHGLSVSGGCALYNPDGALVFSGGLTAGRGHEGGSAGHDAVRALVLGAERLHSLRDVPVYGCTLSNADVAAGGAE